MAALTLKQALAQFWLQITNKFVSKESGKGLSTNDYSDADKQKLESIPDTIGTITGVTAGNGLTGGGVSGNVTLNVNAGSGIKVAADSISVNTDYTTSGKNYKVQADGTSGGLFVNVPWTDNNTTYSAGTGISINNTTISNSGVRSISSGSTEGTISVNTNGTTTNVAVTGLGSAAYTSANNYAQASSLNNYLPLAGGSLSGRTYSSVTVDADNSSFRNIRIISPNVEVIAGETEIPTGEIWLRYEE